MAQVDDNQLRSAPKRPRGRRRRRSAYALLVAGALWLLGYGMGWFGSASDPGRGDQGERRGSQPDAEKVDGQGQRVDGDRRQPADGAGPGNVLAAAPTGETDPAADPETDASGAGLPGKPASERARLPEPEPGLEPDRFASLMSLLRAHLDDGALPRASELLQRLRPQVGGDQEQARAVQQFAERLARAEQAAEAAIVAHLRAGEVLAADLVVERLAGDTRWAPASELAAMAELGEDWSAAVGTDGLPSAAPLPRKRRVRLLWQEGLQEGAVAGTRPQRTTVHLRSASGQSYPTVATIAVEPVDSTQREAIEMGLAAVHAAAPRLARLWLVRALLLSDELDERGRSLRDALRGR
ncbi:MAG: hypothetical protein ACE37K_03315 [Planctomycetota bacterium]